jgi:hypothetical protein
MYLIVSATKNYKAAISFTDDVINANTVGHEIHVTRPIVMILLSMGLITSSDTIVTRNDERFFLYSNIFNNIIGYDDLPSDVDASQIIDIIQANMWFHGGAHMMPQTSLEKRFPIMTQIRLNQIPYRTETYNNLITNIDFKHNIVDKEYILIHHRLVNYSNESNYTKDIISCIKSIDPNIQIIIFSIKKLDIFPPEIIIVNDLQSYASLMYDKHCKIFISEFSGGGQLSQYCHRNKIFYFGNAYIPHLHTNIKIDDMINQANLQTSFYNMFDWKVFTDTSIYVFSNINSLLTNMNKYYHDTDKKYLRI